ncbi:MAG: effector protein [Vigna little leaf phytoplasma]|nr:effector protein [Vigna little leaf phytoplasma]
MVINLKNKLFLFISLLLCLIGNNGRINAVSKEEYINNTRIVNITVSNKNIIKNHDFFKKYFDYTQLYPCYNASLEEFAMIWKIKNPPSNLLGVFFDKGERFAEDNQYSLEDLKYMCNGADNMYIFWQYA